MYLGICPPIRAIPFRTGPFKGQPNSASQTPGFSVTIVQNPFALGRKRTPCRPLSWSGKCPQIDCPQAPRRIVVGRREFPRLRAPAHDRYVGLEGIRLTKSFVYRGEWSSGTRGCGVGAARSSNLSRAVLRGTQDA